MTRLRFLSQENVFFTLVLLVGAVVFTAFAPRSTHAQGRGPQPVVVDPVREEPILEHRLVTGEIRALRSSQVATEEPGLVVAILAREGQLVEQGAVMAELDATRLKLDLAVVQAEERVVRAQLEEQRHALEQAVRDMSSLQALDEKGAANPKELADARTTRLSAEARVAQAEASIQQNQARAALLQRRIRDTRIHAPFRGVVVRKNKEVGEWATPGEALFEVVSAGPVEAWLEVPQAIFDTVNAANRNHAPIHVRVEAAGLDVTSTEARAVPRIDTRARSFPLVVRLDNKKGALAPGMSVTARVPAGQKSQHLTVAKDALLRGDVGTYVYVARETAPGQPALAFPVSVRTLFSIDSRMAVEAPGLHVGDLVVVEGNERLFPMTPVKPQTEVVQANPTGARPPAGKSANDAGKAAGEAGKPAADVGKAGKAGKQPDGEDHSPR